MDFTSSKQINEKGYETELKAKGVHEIFKYGVAFSGKNVEIFPKACHI